MATATSLGMTLEAWGLLEEALSVSSSSRRPSTISPGTSIRYYWLVDPELRSFEIWELGADRRYVRACAALEGRIESVRGCQGLAVDLDELWAEVDRLVADTT